MEPNQNENNLVDSIDTTANVPKEPVAAESQESTPIADLNVAQQEPDIRTSCGCGGATTDKKSKCHCLTTVFNIALLIGLVGIYVLFFTNKGESKHNPAAIAPLKSGALKIAYINTDTLMAKYQYATDLQKELEAYRSSQENSYKQQTTQFQNDYNNYLKNGKNLTLTQQQNTEAELKKRADKLQSLESQLTMQIQEKTVKESEKMTNAVYAFIREYNKDNQQFDLILAKSFASSPVLYGDEGMDITKEIVEGLNKEYKDLKDKK